MYCWRGRCAVRGIETRNARCRRLAPFIYVDADDGQPAYHDVIVRLTEPVTWALSHGERRCCWTFRYRSVVVAKNTMITGGGKHVLAYAK